MAAHSSSRLGLGGMISKIEAARRATDAGAHVCICNGKRPGVLNDLFAGRCPGTLFIPQRSPDLSSRERWIVFGKSGVNKWIIVDEGAKKALIEGKKSLLPVGVRDVQGAFERGDVVEIRDASGARLGKGLVNYDSEDIRKIMGAKSDAIEKILGQKEYDEVIHRDNLIIFP